MDPLRRPLSIRAGVVLQLALVATASSRSSRLRAEVIEVTMQRRHVEAGISVAGVVRKAVEKEMAENPGPEPLRRMLPGPFPPTSTSRLLPERRRGPPKVVPVERRRFRSSRCIRPWT